MTRSRSTILVLLTTLLIVTGCATRPPAPPPSAPTNPAPTTTAPTNTAPTAAVDFPALERSIEESITTGSAALDNIRAVLVVVDGTTEIAHYRHGFTADDHEHVFSVTKSVVSTLIGIAIGEHLIADLDQPLSVLLPEHRDAMTPAVAKVTLREVLTMSGGFTAGPSDQTASAIVSGRIDLVDWAVSKGQQRAAGVRFGYSDVSAHLAAAVLSSALRRNPATEGQSVLDYARAKLFDPLGIQTRPADQHLLREDDPATAAVGFGWMAIRGVELGGFGLRLTAEDMAKLGRLHLDDGVWEGRRLLPEGWVAQATTPSELERSYGLFWWRDNQWGHQLYAAVGARGQRIVVVPDRRAVIVVLSAAHAENELDTELVSPIVNDVIIRGLH